MRDREEPDADKRLWEKLGGVDFDGAKRSTGGSCYVELFGH
jgi:hypothetical protein